jgi:hypothetical protein
MIMAYLEFLSWHLLVGTEQKLVNLKLGSWSKGQYLNLGYSEYEIRVRQSHNSDVESKLKVKKKKMRRPLSPLIQIPNVFFS